MSEVVGPLLAACTAVAAGLFLNWGLRPRQRNNESYHLAQRLGLRYTLRDDDLAEVVADEHLDYRFRRANDIVHGDFFGYPVVAFNYSDTIGTVAEARTRMSTITTGRSTATSG